MMHKYVSIDIRVQRDWKRVIAIIFSERQDGFLDACFYL